MYTVPTMHAIFFLCACVYALLGEYDAIKPNSTNQLTTILQSINQPQPLVSGEGSPKNTFALRPHT